MQKQLCLGTITDVYNCIRNSELFRAGDSVEEFEEFDLLAWFLTNYKKVGAEPTTIWSDTSYYAGNHAHEEWSIAIARIDTPWGKCVKVVESYYDNAFYSYDSSGWERETIFMFAEKAGQKKFYVAMCHNFFNPTIKEGFDDEERANAYLFAMRGEHPENKYILLTTVPQDASANSASSWQELDDEMYNKE